MVGYIVDFLMNLREFIYWGKIGIYYEIFKIYFYKLIYAIIFKIR